MSAVLMDAIERIDNETCAATSWDNEWDKTWDQTGGANWHKYWNNNSGW